MSAENSILVQIARPYASALFDLARETKSVAEVEKGLDSISALIGSNKDFARFIQSPVISADDKRGALDALLSKAKTNTLVANFLRIIARNGRLFAVPAMISRFKLLAAAERGEVAAEVTSAAKLNDKQIKLLADTLKKKIGKTVTLETHVDPELIGGLVVKVGSQMIDTSLKTKLTAMKIAMKEVG